MKFNYIIKRNRPINYERYNKNNIKIIVTYVKYLLHCNNRIFTLDSKTNRGHN